MRLRLRLSAVLMLVNLAVIALPLGSIFFFPLFEFDKVLDDFARDCFVAYFIVDMVDTFLFEKVFEY